MTDQEIVRAAAERVMGWDAGLMRETERPGGLKYRRADGSILYFRPLESIADAWMLVEKLTDSPDGIAYMCDLYRIGLGSEWKCQFSVGEEVYSHEATITRAITLAALQSVGIAPWEIA